MMEGRKKSFSSTIILLYLFVLQNLKTSYSMTVTDSKAQFVTNKMCPFAQKAWIALESSGISFTFEEISLYGSGGKPPWFMKLNPAGTVPVLNINDGEVILPDSELILDYIHEKNIMGDNGNDFDEITKLKIDEWRSIVNKKLIPIGKKAVLGGSKQKLYNLLSDMNTQLKAGSNGKYLCGNSITVADCCLFPFLWRLDQEYGIEDYETLSEWLNTCKSEESFKKTIQHAWWWWW